MGQINSTQSFREQIYITLTQHSLLNHPFYRLWSAGKLTRQALQGYTKEYYSLEAQFPQLLLNAETNTADKKTKAVIMENYAEETQQPSHKELWLDFAEGLGMNHAAVKESPPLKSTTKTCNSLHTLSKNSANQALASLLAYEWNLQQTAATKADGLKKFYNISSTKALSFFTVHSILDIKHSKAWETILISDARTDHEQNTVIHALTTSMKALWLLLDGILKKYQPMDACASQNQ